MTRSTVSAATIPSAAALGNDRLFGDAGADFLSGDDGDDYLDAGDDADADQLAGGNGNDTLIDGETMLGGFGADTFVLTSWKTAAIVDAADAPSNIDVLRLPAGIAPSDVSVERGFNPSSLQLDDLILRRKSEFFSPITVTNFFLHNNGDFKIDRIEFADGTVWDVTKVFSLVKTSQVTEGDDGLVGYRWDDTIDGLGGNDGISGSFGNDSLSGDAGDDQLRGDEGNDLLSGGDGNDTLYGNSNFGDAVGDDTLVGGRGRDALFGGLGDDTYRFNRGDGDEAFSTPAATIRCA